MAKINIKKVFQYLYVLFVNVVNRVVTRQHFAVLLNAFGCDVSDTIKLTIFDNVVCADHKKGFHDP